MSQMTYKEFGELVTKMGYQAWLNFEAYVQVADESGATVAVVSKEQYKVLSLDWIAFNSLTDDEGDLLADACWKLASTPLKDREEPKKYYFAVKPEYRYLFIEDQIYLNHERASYRFTISNKRHNDRWRTTFNEQECEILESDYDLSLFEKVEVTDEELEK